MLDMLQTQDQLPYMFPLLFDYDLLGKTMVLYDSRMMEYTEVQNHCCHMTQLFRYSSYDTTHTAWGASEFGKLLPASVKRNSHFGIKTQITCVEGSGKYLDLRRMTYNCRILHVERNLLMYVE
jgi:hypothetical protein